MVLGMRGVVLVGAVSLAAGALIQKQWDGRELQKVQDLLSTSERNHTVTVVHEERKPDGTIITDTKKTEDQIKKEIEKHIAETSKPVLGPAWFISAGASLDLDKKQYYQVKVDRQILGPIWLGAYGNTHKEAGLSVGVQF